MVTITYRNIVIVLCIILLALFIVEIVFAIKYSPDNKNRFTSVDAKVIKVEGNNVTIEYNFRSLKTKVIVIPNPSVRVGSTLPILVENLGGDVKLPPLYEGEPGKQAGFIVAAIITIIPLLRLLYVLMSSSYKEKLSAIFYSSLPSMRSNWEEPSFAEKIRRRILFGKLFDE